MAELTLGREFFDFIDGTIINRLLVVPSHQA